MKCRLVNQGCPKKSALFFCSRRPLTHNDDGAPLQKESTTTSALCISAQPGRNVGEFCEGSGRLQTTDNHRGSCQSHSCWKTPTNSNPDWWRPVLALMTDSVCIPGCFWLCLDRDKSHSAEPSATSALQLFNKAHLEGIANKGGAASGFRSPCCPRVS